MAEVKGAPSSQLHRLQELQSSLKTIKTRIQYLMKEESKNQKNVQKALKSSISKIGHKANQAKFYEEMRSLHEKENMNKSVMHTSIIQYKEKHRQDISSIKQNILEMKKAETNTMKEISRRNEQIIRESRRRQAEAKKTTIDQLRFLRNQTKKQLNRKKEEEERELQRKKEEAMAERLQHKRMVESKISELESLELKLMTKIEESQKTVRVLKEVVDQSIKIPKQEFYKIIKEVKKEKGKHVMEEEINEAVFERIMKERTEKLSMEGSKRSNTGRMSSEQGSSKGGNICQK